MLRRRLIIEWNDEGTDTDSECLQSFLSGEWTINDLLVLDRDWMDDKDEALKTKLKVWVEDAAKPHPGMPTEE